MNLKVNKYINFLVIIFLTIGSEAYGQTELSYWGTDFWVGFLRNWHDTDVDSYSFNAVGPRTCTVTISNPQTNWSHTMTVSPGQVSSYTVPSSQASNCYQTGSCVVKNTGIHVTSTDTIMLFVFNSSGTPNSCDASSILPTSSLGSSYIVATYPVNTTVQDYYSCFNVVATEDNTIVDIQLSGATSSGHTAGDMITVTLNAGQQYQVSSPQYVGDFSGTRVAARGCKRIAVYSGASLVRIPSNGVSGDHFFLQVMPTQTWGQNWVMYSTPGLRTLYQLLSEEDCFYSIMGNNGQWSPMTLLPAGTSCFFAPTEHTLLQTTAPASVYGYTYSRPVSGNGAMGDVSGFAVPPIEQAIKSVRFATFNVHSRSPYMSQYKVNVVVPSAETSLLRLDGNSVTSFQTVSNGTYSFAQCQVSSGSHTLTTTGNGFLATAYGMGEDWESWGMNLGSRVDVINEARCDTVDTIICSLPFSYMGSSFASEGDYLIGDSCVGMIYLTIHYLSADETYLDTSVCGDRVSLMGRTYTQSGQYTDTIVLSNGCQTVFHLNLHLNPNYSVNIDTSTCTGEILWGDTLLTVGTHRIENTSVWGCDSVTMLTLSAGNSYYEYLDTSICGESFVYGDTSISTSGEYTFTYRTSDGCDSTVTLQVQIHPTYLISIDTPACTPNVVWNDSVVNGSRDFVYHTVYGCDSVVRVHVSLLPSFDTLYYVSIPDTESYTWINGVTYSHNIDTSIVFTNQFGCDSVIRLHLEMERVPQNAVIWIPNVFTPDKTENNVFQVYGKNLFDYEIWLFQRWGMILFHSTDLSETWDGTFKGTSCQQGTYTYIIHYRDEWISEGVQTIVGTVTLLR